MTSDGNQFKRSTLFSSATPGERLLPQFGLRTLLLLIAAAAPWIAWYSGQKSIREQTQAIKTLHLLAPELYIRNVSEYACLAIDRGDDAREYDCFLPEGETYRLGLIWSKEFPSNGPLEAEESTTVAPGRHKIILDEQPERLTVTIDGNVVFDVPRPRPNSRSTSSSGVSERFENQWHAKDKPLVLLRMHEVTNNASFKDPGLGVALWIEPAKDNAAKSPPKSR